MKRSRLPARNRPKWTPLSPSLDEPVEPVRSSSSVVRRRNASTTSRGLFATPSAGKGRRFLSSGSAEVIGQTACRSRFVRLRVGVAGQHPTVGRRGVVDEDDTVLRRPWSSSATGSRPNSKFVSSTMMPHARHGPPFGVRRSVNRGRARARALPTSSAAPFPCVDVVAALRLGGRLKLARQARGFAQAFGQLDTATSPVAAYPSAGPHRVTAREPQSASPVRETSI